jgi:hypothetical protein
MTIDSRSKRCRHGEMGLRRASIEATRETKRKDETDHGLDIKRD